MDSFPILVVGGLLVFVGLLVLLARLYPGSGADLLDWGSTRSYEHEIELDMQDVEQMIEEFREDVVRDEVRRMSEGGPD